MREIYFPGFNFKTFEPVKLLVENFADSPKIIDSDKAETVDLDDLVRKLFSDSEKMTQIPWTQNQVKKEFMEGLRSLNTEIGHSGLTIRDKVIRFVTPEVINRLSDLEGQAMQNRYHEIIELAGSCRRNLDGTFLLKIGFATQEETTSKDTILGVMAHEYGHALGEILDSAVFEELKAYAFENFFLRCFKKRLGNHLTPMLDEGVHD